MPRIPHLWEYVEPPSGVPTGLTRPGRPAIVDGRVGSGRPTSDEEGRPIDRAACLERDLPVAEALDARPFPGDGADRSGFWYLARSRTSCGLGEPGRDSSGLVRSLPDCP